jgi:hypothetical protein
MLSSFPDNFLLDDDVASLFKLCTYPQSSMQGLIKVVRLDKLKWFSLGHSYATSVHTNNCCHQNSIYNTKNAAKLLIADFWIHSVNPSSSNTRQFDE